jgi:predicted transcriptional regulator
MTSTTTTIRVDDDLKRRVAAAADRAGTTPHAFIIDAIERTVEQSEADDELHRLADKRWTKIVATGQAVRWEDARKYLEARVRGEHPPRPAPRKIGR